MIELIKKTFEEVIKEEESLKNVLIGESDKRLGEEVKARARCARRLIQIEKRIIDQLTEKKSKRSEYI